MPVQEEKQIETLPSEEQEKVTGSGGPSDYGTFKGKIYNGSSWTIKRLVIRIQAKEKNGVIRWDRRFETSPGFAEIMSPLSTSTFEGSVDDIAGLASADWSIADIQGYRGE